MGREDSIKRFHPDFYRSGYTLFPLVVSVNHTFLASG